ncbi:MAG: 30S ribosomal protein S1 [Phototrophicaceae bacterium]
MHALTGLDTFSSELDFAALLDATFDNTKVERGDIIEGVILAIDNQGLIVDVNLMRDGIVPRRDLERLDPPPQFEVGQIIDVSIIKVEDDDGNLVLSIAQAQQNEDWKHAQRLIETEEVWATKVADANKGGLIVLFGNLRGFIPASHVADLPRGLDDEKRFDFLKDMVGKTINTKVIEVNHKRRRLVFSQREAQRNNREARKDLLLSNLAEGDVLDGVISGLRDFGAFVDLGGADGLIHISELAWHRVQNPADVVTVGQKVQVYVLRLDQDGKRIGLSLKRLQPNPWAEVEDRYHVGQMIEGKITRLSKYGAFVTLEPGVEALLHISQLANTMVNDPSEIVAVGQVLMMRIISIEVEKQRLGLSIRDLNTTTPESVMESDTSPVELATV